MIFNIFKGITIIIIMGVTFNLGRAYEIMRFSEKLGKSGVVSKKIFEELEQSCTDIEKELRKETHRLNWCMGKLQELRF